MAEKKIERNRAIFTGKNYSTWKAQVVSALAKEGLRSLMTDRRQEAKYLQLDPEERPDQMANYNTKQGKGLSIIYDPVSYTHLTLPTIYSV